MDNINLEIFADLLPEEILDVFAKSCDDTAAEVRESVLGTILDALDVVDETSTIEGLDTARDIGFLQGQAETLVGVAGAMRVISAAIKASVAADV